MKKTSITPAPLKKGRESFYVKEEEGTFWLGYEHAHGYHNIPISEEFYRHCLQEAERQQLKLKRVLKQKP